MGWAGWFLSIKVKACWEGRAGPELVNKSVGCEGVQASPWPVGKSEGLVGQGPANTSKEVEVLSTLT